MSLTDTSWTPKQRKKNSRFISSPRKERPDRNTRQILSLNQILKATALTKESNRIQQMKIAGILKRSRLRRKSKRKSKNKNSEWKLKQIHCQIQIRTAKELTKESIKMNLIETTWIKKHRKLNSRDPRKQKTNRSKKKSSQSLYLNQILTAKEQTRESSRMELTQTTWTPIQRKLNSRCPSSIIKKRINRKSKRALCLSPIQRVKELTKESNKMNSTETSWTPERRKKNLRLLSRSRKR